MIKALLKKQWLAAMSFLLQGKDGKRRSKAATVGFAVLMLYGLGAMGALFWLIAESLCLPLVSAGMGWVYFAFIGTLATGFGIIGGVFTAKTKLYEAKDNDLLFAMPIPAWMILLVRMAGLYAFTLLFEGLVFLPAAVQYFIVAGVSFAGVLSCLVILLVMPLLALAICSLLGFVLAWVSAKLPFKNLFTLIGVTVFMIVYMMLYSKMNEYLAFILANGEAVGAVMKTALYPFSQLGLAAEGNVLSLFLFVLMFGGAFALVYLFLFKTYFRVATMKRGERKAKYKPNESRISSPQAALFKKEFLQFIKNPMYMLNASMGTLIALICGIMMAIYGDFFGMDKETISAIPALKENIGLIVAAIVCFMASSNTITACAVSLEGERIWLPQSLPVSEWTVLKAKLYLHFVMTATPSALFGLAAAFCVNLSWGWTVAVVAVAVISSALFAAMGLVINLKFPSLRWTNEIAAIKQSVSVLIAMFGGWGAALLPLGGYFLFGKYLPAWGYLLVGLGLLLAATAVLIVWLKKRGTKIFKRLSA